MQLQLSLLCLGNVTMLIMEEMAHMMNDMMGIMNDPQGIGDGKKKNDDKFSS